MQTKAFTMVEILLVIVMISAGLLPIYSLIHSSNKQIVNTDTRIFGTIYGTSAIELIRTFGYSKVLTKQSIEKEEEYQEMYNNALKNGYIINLYDPETNVIEMSNGEKEYLVCIRLEVMPKEDKIQGNKQILRFSTLLTDPRANNY